MPSSSAARAGKYELVTRSGVAILMLARELVAVGGRRDLERVDDAAEDAVVAGARGQLEEPLRAVALEQRVEGRLLDLVLAEQLLGVGDDLALLGGELAGVALLPDHVDGFLPHAGPRSEEHTSELQSRLHLVCRLLLEKK